MALAININPAHVPNIGFSFEKSNIDLRRLKESINRDIVVDSPPGIIKPSKFSKPIAQVKKGRLLLIKKCETQWCKIQTGEFIGWVNVENVWGPTN